MHSCKKVILTFLTVFTLIHCKESDRFIYNIESLLSLKQTITDGSLSGNLCWQTLKYLIEYDPNAYQYFDASAKLSSGISGGNFYNLGDFDMCYDLISHIINGKTLHGKYCLGSLFSTGGGFEEAKNIDPKELWRDLSMIQNFSPTPRLSPGGQRKFFLRYAYCFPSSCSAEDIADIIGSLLSVAYPNSSVIFTEDLCYSKESYPKLTGGAVFTIVFLTSIVCVVLGSTIYEYYFICNEKKPPQGILLAFSAYTNGKKLLSTTTNPDQLLCLNGIRAISMAWVVLGHGFSTTLQGPISNTLYVNKTIHNKAHMWLLNAPLSVDTFFTIAGLVTTCSLLRATAKGIKFNIILYYVHRYLRLTPAFAAMILIHVNLTRYLGIGPTRNDVKDFLEDNCRNYWWSSLLYIQNLINVDNLCVPQTWYLSVDFQMFFFSPLVLYPMTKWPKVGYSILAALILLGFLIPTLVSYKNKLVGFLITSVLIKGEDVIKTSQNFMSGYYLQSYTRFGPYVIGMAFGILVYGITSKRWTFQHTRLNKFIAAVIWLISLTGLFACLYGGADLMINDEYDRVATAFYNGFNRNAWAISLCLLILLCVSNFGGPINAFLSASIFQFLTKLSYCIYLVHFSFITLRVAAIRKEVPISFTTMMYAFWGDFMYIAALSLLLCLCFESPIITMEKYLFGNPSRAQDHVNNKQSTKHVP